MNHYENKKVLVVGLGRSGIAAARVALRLGACVSVQDSREESAHDSALLAEFREKGVSFFFASTPAEQAFDQVILSPGVSPELDFVQDAKENGAEIIGELEFAYRIGKGTYIAITGTNGKTTTTTLVGEIFRASGRRTHVVGNIGVAVATAAAESTDEDWFVTECSSFQLETTTDFHPRVSAMLNLTPDHLNRHHTMENYAKAKAKIFQNQTQEDYFIFNEEDELLRDIAKDCKAKTVPFSSRRELPYGAFVQDGNLVIAEEGNLSKICGCDELKIIGEHNLQNALAAAAIAYFAGIDAETIGGAIRAFGGVEHRIEYCGTHAGVRYYNDSKGTNTDATITALKAVAQNIILIAGGDSKGQNFEGMVAEFSGRVKKMILLGRDAHFIAEAADACGFSQYVYAKDMEECVEKAASLAEEGDSVLLSPACASWDMYDNYEQRGEHFKTLVGRLR